MKKFFRNLLNVGLAIALCLSPVVLSACGKEENKGEVQNYNMYMTVATNPTMYATLNMYSNTDENYIIYARKGTIDALSLPVNATIIPTADTINNELTIDVVKMGQKIKSVLKNNSKAHITFYVDDLNTQFFLDAVYAAGVPVEQFKLVLITDGSGTYSGLQKEVSGMNDDQIIEYYKYCVDSYNALYAAYEEGATFVNYTNGSRANATTYTDVKVADVKYKGETVDAKGIYGSTMMNLAILNTDKGFEREHQVQFADGLSSLFPATAYPKFNAEIEKANIKGFNLKTMFQALTKQQNNDIINGALNAAFIADARLGYYVVDGVKVFDKSSADHTVNKNTTAWTVKDVEEQYFTAAVGDTRKTLVIIGTVSGEKVGETTPSGMNAFEQTLRGIDRLYGDEYRIVYKPHPSQNYSEAIMNVFNELDIQVMPGRFMAQFIMWSFDVKLGGYSGSSWYDADPAQTLFFIDGYDAMTGILFKDYLDGNQENGEIPILGNPIPAV